MSYKHILDAAALCERELSDLFRRAEFFLDSQNAYEPPCKGKTLFNIFLENSTRTRASFEVAGQRLGMNVVNITGDTSSVRKGESLVDTVRTICAMGADVITIRIRDAGVIAAAAAIATCPVINAGEGAYQHPTQAFLDAFTIARSLKRNRLLSKLAAVSKVRGASIAKTQMYKKVHADLRSAATSKFASAVEFGEKSNDFEGLKVAICGDVLHSRVARSNIQLLNLLGAEIILAGPPSLIPRCISGVSIAGNLEDAIADADVIIMLRIQSERMQAGFIPSLADYHEVYGLKEKHLEIIKPGALIMHPGPVNWGVEMSRFYEARPDITMITQQVQAGVAVRTALLEMLL